MTATPVLLSPGEGETISDRAERTVRILLDREEVTVTRSRYEPGERGPDPHIHKRHADAFYVLEGELEFGLGGDRAGVRAPARTLVLVPQGVVHTFGNESGARAVFLNIHAPSMGFGESLRLRRDGRRYEAEEWDTFDPPPDGGRSPADVVVRGPGEGDAITMGASQALFKAEGVDGEGTFSLTEVTLEPGFPGPLPHRHRTHVDTFYVLAGVLTLSLDGRDVEAHAGSYATVPPGNTHTFSNRSEETVRALNLMTPGGFEQYLKEVARSTAGGPPDPQAMAEIASRYDFEPV